MIRLAIAFLAAPVLPAIVKTWLVSRPDDTLSLSLLVLIAGLFYAMQLVVGVPGYLVMHRYRQTDALACIVLGFLVMAIPIALSSLYWCVGGTCVADTVRYTADSGLYGFAMGAMFWLVAQPGRPVWRLPSVRTARMRRRLDVDLQRRRSGRGNV